MACDNWSILTDPNSFQLTSSVQVGKPRGQRKGFTRADGVFDLGCRNSHSLSVVERRAGGSPQVARIGEGVRLVADWG